MPNVTLKKSDKVAALHKMINAKYRNKHNALVSRQQDLAMKIYDETKGKVGWALKAAAGKDWLDWLDTASQVEVIGMESAVLFTESSKRRYGVPILKEFFTGSTEDSFRKPWLKVSLKNQIPEPSRCYSQKGQLKSSDATKPTQKKLATLNRDITAFNDEISDFYWRAYQVLMSLRTSRQVDDKFPELWRYLPEGTRERIKQAVVVPQSQIDQIRNEVS